MANLDADILDVHCKVLISISFSYLSRWNINNTGYDIVGVLRETWWFKLSTCLFTFLWRCGNVGKTTVWNEKSLNPMVNLVPSRCYPQPLTVLKQGSWNSFAFLPLAYLILYRRKHMKSRSYSLQWNITHIGGLRK